MAVTPLIQLGGVCLLICCLIYISVSFTSPLNYFHVRAQKNDEHVSFPPPHKPIIIYVANNFFSERVSGDRFLSECTPFKRWCTITQDVRNRSRADAIVFHNRNFNMASERKQGNKSLYRDPDVPYVLWSMESPSNDNFRLDLNFINWTMTYRRDADVWFPYGRMERLPMSITVNYEDIWDMKNPLLPPATWLVSNCHSSNRRRIAVAQLEERGLEVDKWGHCGRPTPACNDTEPSECINGLIKQYKFYLAFENSNCVDYVTEKFFDTMRSRFAVPIVLHRKIYEDLGIPSSAFIALSDYKSPSEAVRDIHRIGNDKDVYLKYHKWREDYEAIFTLDNRMDYDRPSSSGFCALCRTLAERSLLSPDDRISARKSYRRVQDWHAIDMCDNSPVWSNSIGKFT